MSVSTRVDRRHSPLPLELTPLLGRDREAVQLRNLIDDPSIRLVTITGPGGVGKTRLALHVAATLVDDFDNAVTYVPLASIRDPHLVLPEIAQHFGVFSDPRVSPEDQLVDVLRDQLMLLVLDNMEQVLDVAATLARVLSRCPRVTMLVTSQAALEISGEQLYPLSPLPTPASETTSPTAIMQSDAVNLFIQRARAANPNLKLDDRAALTIAEICRKLDGLPLAIELAAARTTILSPEALLARLSNRLQVLGGGPRDVPDRLRTMRNAIAWSYDLLAPEEQVLFRHLSVFVGGIPLDANDTIVELPTPRDAFDVLSTLVNHSLVQPVPGDADPPRFMMLETIRDYGLEQLRECGEEQRARLAHATYVVDLAETAGPALVGRGQDTWTARLEPESENLRAACTWAIENDHPTIPLRIGGAIWRYCATHGLAADCRLWIERGLTAGDAADPHWRTRAMNGAGNLYEDLRDLDAARMYFEQCHQLAIETDNLLDHAQALMGLGTLAHDTGSYADAFELHSQAAELARMSGNLHCIARSVGNMGTVSYFRGHLDEALRCWEEAREIMAEIGDVVTEALITSNMGALAFEQGDLERAEKLQLHALELQRQIRTTRDIPYTLINLGEVSCLLGNVARSHECFNEAIELLRQEGNKVIEGIALNGVGRLAMREGNLSRAAALAVESTRLVAEANDQRSILENLELLAEICSLKGDHNTTAELIATSTVTRKVLESEFTPQKAEIMAALERAARKALGGDAFTRAWERGGQLALAELPNRVETVAYSLIGDDLTREDPIVSPAPERPRVEHNLTARELEVLQLLVEGRSTAQISEELFISPRTTSTHITNILGKLEVSSRTAAVALALREGFV